MIEITGLLHIPEIETVDIGSVTLRAGYWHAPEPSGKRPIVFFNGIGANLELAYPFAENVRDRDVLTFDVPGVGGSPATIAPYRLWRLARWVKQLTKHYGFNEVDVAGLSWGGAAAQQFTFQYPGFVRRAVFIATTPGFVSQPGKLRSLSKMLHFKRYSQPEFMKQNFEKLYGEELNASGLRYTVLMNPPSVRGYIYQLLALSGWSSIPFLPSVRQPVLVIMGDRDTIVPVFNGRLISKLAGNAQFRVVEDGGHLFLVTKAESIVPEILNFLDAPLKNNPPRSFCRSRQELRSLGS